MKSITAETGVYLYKFVNVETIVWNLYHNTAAMWLHRAFARPGISKLSIVALLIGITSSVIVPIRVIGRNSGWIY